MVYVPTLSRGPFGLDLDTSARYITYIFKGMSVGVVISTVVTAVLLEITLSPATSTGDQVTSVGRELILCLCVCAFAVAYFFLCSFLFKGIEERNRTWIFPWFLVTAVIGFSLVIILFVSFANGIGMIHLILPLFIAFIFYGDLVVYSLYVDLGTSFVPETPPTQVVPA